MERSPSRRLARPLPAVLLALSAALALGFADPGSGEAPERGARPVAAVAGNAGQARDAFKASVERLSPKLRRRMTGSSWHEGCPVGLGRLRVLHVTHWDFDGGPRRGALVVHERYARGMAGVMRRLFRKRFPIRRMELIDRYGADDHRSMGADNTSAFNCRFVNGTSRWSMHAYGKAIDVNPRENPYVSGDFVSPPEGAPYADRSPKRKGMIYRKGPVVRSMRRIVGWEWAGAWSGARDYQHFSASGD